MAIARIAGCVMIAGLTVTSYAEVNRQAMRKRGLTGRIAVEKSSTYGGKMPEKNDVSTTWKLITMRFSMSWKRDTIMSAVPC